MNKFKLNTALCFNPYMINGNQVKNIIFYDATGIITKTGRAWFGSNRIKVYEFEALEFTRRLKINTTRKENFFIKSKEQDSWANYVHVDLYVYIPTCGFTVSYLGEQEATKTDNETWFGNFYTIEATFNDGYDFSVDKKETRKFMTATYTRSVLTKQGTIEAKIKEITGLSLTESRVIYKNKSALIDLFNAK